MKFRHYTKKGPGRRHRQGQPGAPKRWGRGFRGATFSIPAIYHWPVTLLWVDETEHVDVVAPSIFVARERARGMFPGVPAYFVGKRGLQVL